MEGKQVAELVGGKGTINVRVSQSIEEDAGCLTQEQEKGYMWDRRYSDESFSISNQISDTYQLPFAPRFDALHQALACVAISSFPDATPVQNSINLFAQSRLPPSNVLKEEHRHQLSTRGSYPSITKRRTVSIFLDQISPSKDT